MTDKTVELEWLDFEIIEKALIAAIEKSSFLKTETLEKIQEMKAELSLKLLAKRREELRLESQRAQLLLAEARLSRALRDERRRRMYEGDAA